MREPPPSIYSHGMVGFGEDFLACTHAIVMEGSLGDDTCQREVAGAAGGVGTP
jgi:hypothetical protein